jgi:8-oxo-dGTP diphosphatase
MSTITVAAAVIERDGVFLLTRRLKGTHLEGTWEFPGGKCEPRETPAACLVREIR